MMQKLIFKKEEFYSYDLIGGYPQNSLGSLTSFLHEEFHSRWFNFLENKKKTCLIGEEFWELQKEGDDLIIFETEKYDYIDDPDHFRIKLNEFIQLGKRWIYYRTNGYDEIIIHENNGKVSIEGIRYPVALQARVIFTRKNNQYTIVLAQKDHLETLANLFSYDFSNKKNRLEITKLLLMDYNHRFGYKKCCYIETYGENAFVGIADYRNRTTPEFYTTKKILLKLCKEWEKITKHKPSIITLVRDHDNFVLIPSQIVES